ncbi:flagellar filament capping protein FliD [Egicoccus sp. AB-alg6-2]|uniref:flagellar filament capping protein FliD n=1 Tax=Egicoccus sp. AB-alg6-2 TaxID=3242692 RepID=UPI00359E3DE7
MSAQGLFSIGGIASGLDTAGIVKQLMQLERQPVVRLQNTQKQLQAVNTAWQSVNTRLSSLRTAVDAISRPDRFTNLVAVSSSNTDAVSVTRAGTGTGSLTFHVDRLAQAHQVATGTFASATDALAASGKLTVQVGANAAVEIDVDAGDSLQAIATRLNGLKAGFTASVVKTGEGEHRLVLNASATGLDNKLTVGGDTGLTQLTAYDADANTNGLRTLQAAQDSQVRMGSGSEAVTITRSGNTIADLVPGASITLKKVTTETLPDGTKRDGVPVTVTAQRDIDGGIAAVKSYVDALNATITSLSELTRYNPETKTAGALQGDPYARQLLDQLRSAATAPLGVTREPFAGAFDVGLSVDRTGKVVLDEAKLRTALNQDFDAVGRLFGRTATPTDTRATAVIGTNATTPGVYEVQVTKAAKAARATGAVFAPDTDVQPKTFKVTAGTVSATVTLNTEGLTASQIVAEINAALKDQKLAAIEAKLDGDNLVFEETRAGASRSFTVEVLDQDDAVIPFSYAAGEDAAGQIRLKGSSDAWTPLGGGGRELNATTGKANGIQITWSSLEAIDPDQPITFDVTYSHGLAGNVANVLRTAEGGNGIVARARKGIDDQIKIYQTRIDGFEQRLLTRESTLIKQFTAMEVALSKMQAQGNWLTSQLAGLNGLSQQQQR